jgi:hypothetical protein
VRYFVRWWTNGQPESQLKQVPDEATTKAKVRAKHAAARFRHWQPTVNNPKAFNVPNVDEYMLAWESARAHAQNHDPVADILRGP